MIKIDTSTSLEECKIIAHHERIYSTIFPRADAILSHYTLPVFPWLSITPVLSCARVCVLYTLEPSIERERESGEHYKTTGSLNGRADHPFYPYLRETLRPTRFSSTISDKRETRGISENKGFHLH